jgi:hypothetical protein
VVDCLRPGSNSSFRCLIWLGWRQFGAAGWDCIGSGSLLLVAGEHWESPGTDDNVACSVLKRKANAGLNFLLSHSRVCWIWVLIQNTFESYLELNYTLKEFFFNYYPKFGIKLQVTFFVKFFCSWVQDSRAISNIQIYFSFSLYFPRPISGTKQNISNSKIYRISQ